MHRDTVCKISGAGAPREFSVLPLAPLSPSLQPPPPHPSFLPLLRRWVPDAARSLSQWPSLGVGLDEARRTYVNLPVPFSFGILPRVDDSSDESMTL